MKRVKVGPWRLSETVVFYLEPGKGDRELVTIDRGSETFELGEVWKSTRTYSPPAAGHGGRIVRFHKQVPCWRTSTDVRAFDTRADALARLYSDYDFDHPRAGEGER